MRKKDIRFILSTTPGKIAINFDLDNVYTSLKTQAACSSLDHSIQNYFLRYATKTNYNKTMLRNCCFKFI